MVEINFSRPYALLLLELVPLMLLFYFRNYRKQRPVIQLSTFSGLSGYQKTYRQRLIHLPFLLRCLGISLLIIAIADPRSAHHERLKDIRNSAAAYVIDQTAAMLATDLSPNRMESLKTGLDNFIRQHADIPGCISGFADDARVECPLTDDNAALLSRLENMKVETTAFSAGLNEGIETGIDLLNQGKVRHKFLICFTASNNAGPVTDEAVSDKIQQSGVTVFMVAIASQGLARAVIKRRGKLIFQNAIVDLDEGRYRRFAGGKDRQYFRVTSNSELDRALLEISRVIEQHKTGWSRNYAGIFPFALVAALILCLELILRYTVLKSLP